MDSSASRRLIEAIDQHQQQRDQSQYREYWQHQVSRHTLDVAHHFVTSLLLIHVYRNDAIRPKKLMMMPTAAALPNSKEEEAKAWAYVPMTSLECAGPPCVSREM